MPDLIVWKDREIDKMKRNMDRLCNQLIDDFCLPQFPFAVEEWPLMNLLETEDELILEVGAPGVKPVALEISVTEDVLTIKGEAEETASETFEGRRYIEQHYGTFTRTLRLPCRIKPDEVTAISDENGFLRITMPKYGRED
ncbi:MAG: Hsp20/alpha crystallin family protein [Deltaproteobacteria bacterium]|nr:Hsp20/alpha crystallin family protein [Deltaproteobacteria bacterium]